VNFHGKQLSTENDIPMGRNNPQMRKVVKFGAKLGVGNGLNQGEYISRNKPPASERARLTAITISLVLLCGSLFVCSNPATIHLTSFRRRFSKYLSQKLLMI